MATTDPLTGATINDQNDAATGGFQIGRVVTDLRTFTNPRFNTNALRDAAYSAAGVTLQDGMTCVVAGRQLMRRGGVWRLVGPSPLPSLTNSSWVLGSQQIITTGSGGFFDLTSVTVADPGFPYRIQVLVACILGAQTNPGSGRFDLSVRITSGGSTVLFDALTLTPDAPSYQRLFTGPSDTEYTGDTTVLISAFRPSGTSNALVQGGNRVLSVYRHAS